jgi:[acyl-carrier-protein] S-malonyltransferase
MAFAGIFPGQGSQSIGMLSNLSDAFPIIKQTFEQASESLGLDLYQLVMQGPEADLNKTVITQPAMLTAGIAVWRLWQEQGGCLPTGLAGHSLGEYSALVASGALDFADAVVLVQTRAQLMQQAVPEGTGAMAAILGLEDDQVVKACSDALGANTDEVVQAVNFNSPGQVVIAGSKDAVARAMELATEAGAKRVIPLPVSVPSHCALMMPAAEQLAEKLKETNFSDTTIPVYHNVDAATQDDDAGIRTALAEQLYKPVKWVDTVNNLKSNLSADSMIEFGPGKVLFGLNRRIDRKIKTICVHDQKSLEKALLICEETA